MNWLTKRLASHSLAAPIVAMVGFAIFLSVTPATLAQEATPGAATPESNVTVSGIGSVQIEPDAAIANIGVSVTESDLSSAMSTANATMESVIASLTESGIASEDIQTSSLFVQPIQTFDDLGNPNEITQFQVQNMVQVTFRDIDELGSTLDAAVAAGANSLWGVEFVVIDRGEAEETARQQAVDDALERATQLADAAGYTLGDVISIQETSATAPVARGAGVAVDEMAAIPIEPGSTTISVRVDVTYELV